MISGNAKLAGVIGWPVGHSLSPLLHGYWLAEYGIDGAYVPLAVTRENFSEALAGLRLAGFRGFNVTVPHKVAAFALAHTHDDEAEATGAANLLLFEDDGRIAARNTDGPGLLASLKDSLGKDALRGKPAVVLGAGGGARAAVRALDVLGASEIRVLNRNGARAEALVAEVRTGTTLSSASLQDWPKAAKGSAIVVNATSGGMKGSSALALSLDRVDNNMAVCELVYNPRESQLLKDARARGLRTIDGLGMLMHQAVPSFEAFFGRRPSVTPGLRSVLEKALDDG